MKPVFRTEAASEELWIRTAGVRDEDGL
jgi:hypothetical protein